jgi:hypothetical protein
MTTKITITNDASSNGDVHIRGTNLWMPPTSLPAGKPYPSCLHPGESAEIGVTDASVVTLFESYPTIQQRTLTMAEIIDAGNVTALAEATRMGIEHT